MIHIVLKLIIHPAGFLYLVGPMGRIQQGAFIKLIVPYQVIALRNHDLTRIRREVFLAESLLDRDFQRP